MPAVTGTVTSYSIAPGLPAGLSINTASGVISGTPTAPALPASYTITASNTGGKSTFSISFAANPTSSSSYGGTYTGSFLGGDSGSFTVTATSQGTIASTACRINSTAHGTLRCTGNIDASGNLTLTQSGTGNGVQFAGIVGSSAATVLGTWEDGVTGTSGAFNGANSANIILAGINSPTDPVLAVAAVKDGSETLSVLGTRDTSGNPTATTSLLYTATSAANAAPVLTKLKMAREIRAAASNTAPSVASATMSVDSSGLPAAVTDSLGNTVTYSNYDLTNYTVDVSVTPVSDGVARPPVKTPFDPAIIAASKALAPYVTTGPALAESAMVVYSAGVCAAAVAGAGPTMGTAAAFFGPACWSTLLTTAAHFTSGDAKTLATTAGWALDVGNCAAGKPSDCAQLAAELAIAVMDAPKQDFSGTYQNGTDSFSVNQSNGTVSGIFDQSSFSGKVGGNVLVMTLQNFASSCPGSTATLTGTVNSGVPPSTTPSIAYNWSAPACSGNLVFGSGSTTTYTPPNPAPAPVPGLGSGSPPPGFSVLEIYKGGLTITAKIKVPSPANCTPNPGVADFTGAFGEFELDVDSSLLSSGSFTGVFQPSTFSGTLKTAALTCSNPDGTTTVIPSSSQMGSSPAGGGAIAGSSDGTKVSFNMPSGGVCTWIQPGLTVTDGAINVTLTGNMQLDCPSANTTLTMQWSLTRQ
jgi:hypothetical protein